MSGVLNDCDALLQGAAVRIVNPKNANIILTADAQAFHVNGSGVADIDTVTVTATLYELDGPLSFSVQGAALSNVTDRTATVTYASMTAPTAIVTATLVSGGVTYSQSCIIAVTQDGTSGGSAKVLTLSATEQVFKITKAGVNSPASITLTASGQNIVGTPSFTIPIGTATLTAGANASQKILTFANMTSDSVTVQIALDGLTDRVTISKVRDGADGAESIVGMLTNESVTLPAGSNGVVSSYSGAVCTMKVYKGTADDSANWAFAYSPATSASSLAYTTSGATLTVTGLSSGVDSAFVDITASRTGYASITKRFSVTKSKAGASVTGDRGAGAYTASGSAWSDGTADAATPGGNVVDDRVTITNGSTYALTKRWDGSAWVTMGAVFDGSLFVTGSIGTAALGAQVVTAEKVAADAVTARSIKVTGAAGSLNRDPYFTDPGSWALGSLTAATGPGGAAPANTYVQGTVDYASCVSERFPIDASKSYNTSVSVWAASGNNRAFRLIVAFYDGAGNVITSSWSDGLGSHFTQNFIPGGDTTWRTYRNGGFGAKVAGRPIPANAKFCAVIGQINAGGTGTSSAMAYTGLRVDEMTSETLIEPDSIYAQHIKGDTLDVLAGKFGVIETGTSGARTKVKDNIIRVFADNGVPAIEIGDTNLPW